MDHASDVYIGGGFQFICLGNFFSVWGVFCWGFSVLWGVAWFHFVGLFSEEPHNVSLCLKNEDVPGTWPSSEIHLFLATHINSRRTQEYFLIKQ